MYKIMISVGEASGDMHGASVAGALKNKMPDIEMFGMGGKNMRAAGVDIVYDIADLGVIGLVEVLKNLRKLFRLRDKMATLMDERKPDALVVIDYPGFNMRLAKIAKQKGIPVISYISPSAWAWGKGRAKEVAETVQKVAAIFPFEAEVYREAGADVAFVGHPLIDIVQPSMSKAEAYSYFDADPAKPVVLLMPGSRLQEITNLLPEMLRSAEKIVEAIPDCQFFLPVASTISQEILQDILLQYKVRVELTRDHNYDLMNIAQVAIAASGTVTLETSIMNLPAVIIYKVAALTYFFGKFLVKIPHIGLPNIVAGRKVVPELLQEAANADNISQEVLAILTSQTEQERIRQDLAEIRRKLGTTGAVEKVAQVILDVVKHCEGSV